MDFCTTFEGNPIRKCWDILSHQSTHQETEVAISSYAADMATNSVKYKLLSFQLAKQVVIITSSSVTNKH